VIRLEESADGVFLPVRAQPGARRNALTGEREGMLMVAVTQAAEKGKANRAVVAVLCDALDLAKSRVVLVAGETSRRKRFLIHGVTKEELAERIDAALDSIA